MSHRQTGSPAVLRSLFPLGTAKTSRSSQGAVLQFCSEAGFAVLHMLSAVAPPTLAAVFRMMLCLVAGCIAATIFCSATMYWQGSMYSLLRHSLRRPATTHIGGSAKTICGSIPDSQLAFAHGLRLCTQKHVLSLCRCALPVDTVHVTLRVCRPPSQILLQMDQSDSAQLYVAQGCMLHCCNPEGSAPHT